MSSEKQRATWRRYNASPKGRLRKKVYEGSAKGLQTYGRYGASPKGKLRSRTYERSPKGLSTKRAQQHRGKNHAAEKD